MDELTKWLFDQVGMIVIMGIAIWWLARRLVRTEQEKNDLSEKVIELATKWESETKDLGEGDKEFKDKVLALLNEIKGNLSK